MSFIGVIANNRDFKNIQKIFLRKDMPNSISLIEINENNIENIRNISFETIIFCKELNCSDTQKIYLNKICENAFYLIINSDFNWYIPPFTNNECTIITFGLNQKATVTVSSISENGFVLSLQSPIVTVNKAVHEIEEKSIKTKNPNNFKLYKILVEYIIKIIYKKNNL